MMGNDLAGRNCGQGCNELVVRWNVREPDAGRMVREILQQRLRVSRRLIRLAVSHRGVRKNGLPAYLSERVSAGDVVELCWPEVPSDDVVPEPIPFETVYEDEDVLVVNKPPGMLVHPTKGAHSGTLANGVVYAWRRQGSIRPFRPLHRLDRDTSGLVLIAKNQFAHQRLSVDLQTREGDGTEPGRMLRREYHAVVCGTVPADRGWIDLPIGRDPAHPNRRRIDPQGRRAGTRFDVIGRAPGATLLRVRLETGRTHQIRLHLAEIGHPVVGDSLYGAPSPWIGRQALHAGRLKFCHPRTGVCVEVQSPWFPDMAHLWKRLASRGSGE